MEISKKYQTGWDLSGKIRAKFDLTLSKKAENIGIINTIFHILHRQDI